MHWRLAMARAGVAVLAVAGPAATLLTTGAARAAEPTGPAGKDAAGSGLLLPRFVSLKADKVNVRQGPDTDQKIAWVFQQAGLPVEVIQEHGPWRRVRDSEGATGWVFHAMLSGRRTALVLPWELKAGELKAGEAKSGETKSGEGRQVSLRARESAGADVVAIVEPGVLANVRKCDGAWCEISIGAHAGFIEQIKLWGVYEKEVVK